MRTWSVSGTALALCTRSSSLSINTRTSMDVQCRDSPGGRTPPFRALLLRVERRAWPGARVELLKAARDRLRDELVDVAAEARDLLDAARRHEAVLGPRHDVDGLDLRREQPVQVVHLEL